MRSSKRAACVTNAAISTGPLSPEVHYPVGKPLAYARGSDRSRDREGAVASRYETAQQWENSGAFSGKSPAHAYRASTGAAMVSLVNRGTISSRLATCHTAAATIAAAFCTSSGMMRSEEHTSELQSRQY